MKKLEVVNYLKGYSIFTIVLMHLIQNYLSMPHIINIVASLGGAGVHVFILCSGFGLFYSYLNKPLTYKSFLKRRFAKIYTPYIIVILISALVPFMYSKSDKLIAILSHVLLFKMFFTKYETSFGGQFWFLSSIIQFYLIFNLLVTIKNKLNDDKKFLCSSLAISIIWWISIVVMKKSDIRIWNSFFLQYLWEFSLGMFLAQKYKENNSTIQLPKKIILLSIAVVGLSLTGVAGILGGTLKIFNDIPSLFGYGAFAVLIYSINVKPINNLFFKLDVFAYEWYLVHILIFSCIFHILKNTLPTLIIGLIAFIISILVAKIYNLIFTYTRKLYSQNYLVTKI